MKRRKYSAEDLSRMRRALDDMYPTYVNFFGAQMGPGHAGIEAMLQTYIASGVTPEELEAMRDTRCTQRSSR